MKITKEYWCTTLVIFSNETTVKKLQNLMDKIEKDLRCDDWDYSAKEAKEKGENFIDIHDWKPRKQEEVLDNILGGTSVFYRWADENLGGCESCCN